MALYDGFFDAVLDATTLQYDREYDSGDFTEYFEEVVGSGVCIHEDENSMKVSWDGSTAVIAPGYLFIQGYWLKNTENYPVSLSGSGVHAVLARLNMGTRRIEVSSQLKADPEVYPDALVLAYVTIDSVGAVTVEDTRYNTDICGIINSAGELSVKVEYAINYINNEIDAKLEEAEADIAAQAALLDAKIEEVGAMAERLAPPPIGTVKFSASQDIEEGWLRCDGRFINEVDYPELVAALGKLTPGVDDFSTTILPTSAGVFSDSYVYGGYLWVYSLKQAILYGVSLTGGTIKSLPVTGANDLVVSSSNPPTLSILDGYIFLAQQTSLESSGSAGFVLLQAEGSPLAISSVPFTRLSEVESLVPKTSSFYGRINGVPEIVQAKNIVFSEGGTPPDNVFILCLGRGRGTTATNDNMAFQFLYWAASDDGTLTTGIGSVYSTKATADSLYCINYQDQQHRLSRKNSKEIFFLYLSTYSSSGSSYYPKSWPYDTYTYVSEVETTGTMRLQVSDYPVISPIVANGKFILRAFVHEQQLYIRAGTINVNSLFPAIAADTQYTLGATNLSLPSTAQIFLNSACYCSSQDLWVIFLGTGFAFTRTPNDLTSWGYLDTTDFLGVVTQYGCAEFSPDDQLLILSGLSSSGEYKVGRLALTEWYQYANDGAFLPNIASDGIPAYIKAKEPEEGA